MSIKMERDRNCLASYSSFSSPRVFRCMPQNARYHLQWRRRPNLWPIFLSISPGSASRASRRPRPRPSRFPPLPECGVLALTSRSIVLILIVRDTHIWWAIDKKKKRRSISVTFMIISDESLRDKQMINKNNEYVDEHIEINHAARSVQFSVRSRFRQRAEMYASLSSHYVTLQCNRCTN